MYSDVAVAAERLYRETLLVQEPEVELALRDGGVRRDFERVVIGALGSDPTKRRQVAEAVLAGGAKAAQSAQSAWHREAFEAYHSGRRKRLPEGLHRFLDLASRPSRWGDTYAAAILADGRPALFRILVQVELGEESRRRRPPGSVVEIDPAFGLGAATDADLKRHVRDAATAAFDFLQTAAPGRPIPDVDRVDVVRVFRCGLPWPLVNDQVLPWAFELDRERELQSGPSMGLPVGLAVLRAFLPGWTTREGPIVAATGELTAEGSVEAVGDVEAKAEVVADAELPFVFPRRGIRRGRPRPYRHIPVDSLVDAARNAFNLAGRDVDGFLATCPDVLYGRDAEMATLAAAWDRARGGERRLALVHGESGIGKSGLVATFLQTLARAGVPVVFAVAGSEGSQVFEPIVSRLVGGSTVEDLRVHADEYGGWIGSMVDGLPRFLPEHFGPSPTESPEDNRERKVHAICALVRDCASRHGGLVLVVDDLQWGGEETWLVLKELLRPDGPLPLLLVATYRGSDARASADAEPALFKLRAAGVVDDIQLVGLAPESVDSWVQAMITEKSGEVSGALAAVTLGHPFRIDQHLKGLRERLTAGRSMSVEDLVASVRVAGPDVIGQRLRAFDRLATLRLAAAVRGREFAAQLLEDTGLIDGEDIRRHLADALNAGFITLVSPSRYAFSHHDTRAAVVALAGPDEAARHAFALATALERRSADGDVRPPVGDLARYFWDAAPVIEEAWEKATHYATLAADDAIDRLAYSANQEFRMLALRAFDRSPLHDPERRCRLLLDVARSLSYVGLEEQARVYFREARELAMDKQVDDLMIEATLGFAGPPEDKGTTDDEMLGFLNEADALPASGTDLRRARLRGRSTFEGVLAARREPDAFVMPPVVELLAQARAANDPIELSWALLSRLMGFWPYEASTVARLELAEEMLALATECGEKDIGAWAHAFRVIHLLELGRRDDAELAVEELAVLGRELHYGYARWGAAVLRPVFAHLDGRFEASRTLSEVALDLRSDALNSVLYQYIQNMLALREEGELAGLETQLATISKLLVKEEVYDVAQLVVQSAWSLLRCESGDRSSARAEMDRLVHRGLPDVIDDPTWTTGMAFMAEACVLLQDVRLVPRLYELLLVKRGECIVVALAVACLGSVDRYLGMLAGLQGEWDLAAEHFEVALVMNRDKLRSATWTAHTEVDYAAVLARRGRPQDTAEARRLCTAGAAVAHEFAMPVLQRQATGVLRSLR